LAKLTWVRARLEFERGTPRHASEMVLAGAEMVYDCDKEEAARMLIEVVRMAYFADEAKAKADLGWSPKYPTYRDGVSASAG